MTDHIADAEILYRRVLSDSKFTTLDSGTLFVAPAAFFDRNKQPSVDRATLCNHDPSYAQADDERTGVVQLVALDVRNLELRKEGNNPVEYAADVIADPIALNPAHAEIRTDPTISSSKVFKRLRTGLAILANQHGWLIEPDPNR